MHTLLSNWREQESRLAERRKYLAEKGYKDGGLEETREEQNRNNKKYDNIMSKAQFRRTVAGMV